MFLERTPMANAKKSFIVISKYSNSRENNLHCSVVATVKSHVILSDRGVEANGLSTSSFGVGCN